MTCYFETVMCHLHGSTDYATPVPCAKHFSQGMLATMGVENVRYPGNTCVRWFLKLQWTGKQQWPEPRYSQVPSGRHQE